MVDHPYESLHFVFYYYNIFLQSVSTVGTNCTSQCYQMKLGIAADYFCWRGKLPVVDSRHQAKSEKEVDLSNRKKNYTSSRSARLETLKRQTLRDCFARQKIVTNTSSVICKTPETCTYFFILCTRSFLVHFHWGLE